MPQPTRPSIKAELAAPPSLEPEREPEQEPRYPVAYYNPIVQDERFVVEGQASKHAFVGGRYIAVNSETEEAVRAALRAYGKDKPDRWRGDDMKRPFTCRDCGFSTRNEAAEDDHVSIKRHV